MLGTIATATVAITGLMIAASDYAPAHRGYVRQVATEIIDSKLKVLEDRQAIGERRQANTQLQVNTLRRDLLEKEKFDLGLRLKDAADGTTRGLIEQRLRQINDDLGDVLNERVQIRATSP